MNYKNIAQAKAIEAKNKKRLLEVNQFLTEESGIYFLTRFDENGIRYAYIGQAKHILTRLAQHLVGYQHIDLSLKKHGLSSTENPYGWKVNFTEFSLSELDRMEQEYIKLYAEKGYQLRNKTAGSQGVGKTQIDEYRPAKGYRDGKKQGYIDASRDIAHLFDLHLDFRPKNVLNPSKNQIKAMEKFENFLSICKGGKEDG